MGMNWIAYGDCREIGNHPPTPLASCPAFVFWCYVCVWAVFVCLVEYEVSAD